MTQSDLRVFGTPGSEWNRGQLTWGSTYNPSPNDPGLSVFGGIGVVNEDRGAFTLIGEGPPKLYELRISTTWGADAAAPGVGLLKARVTSGVGAARHQITCDIGNGAAILVPSGTITVGYFQTDRIKAQVQSIQASIAIGSGEPRAEVTDSYFRVGVAAGPFLSWGDLVPRHVKAVRIGCNRAAGNVILIFANDLGGTVGQFDTGTDPELVKSSVPVPPEARSFGVLYPVGMPNPPVVTWILDC